LGAFRLAQTLQDAATVDTGKRVQGHDNLLAAIDQGEQGEQDDVAHEGNIRRKIGVSVRQEG
jgi:hypothetical protein